MNRHPSTIASPRTALPSYSTLYQAAFPVLRRYDPSDLLRVLAKAEEYRLKKEARRKIAAKRREAISAFRQQHRAPMLIYHWDDDLRMMFAISHPGVKL